jgi:hypothetical protein
MTKKNDGKKAEVIKRVQVKDLRARGADKVRGGGKASKPPIIPCV